MERFAREEGSRGSTPSLALDVIGRREAKEPERLDGRDDKCRDPLGMLALLDLLGGIALTKEVAVIATMAAVICANKGGGRVEQHLGGGCIDG